MRLVLAFVYLIFIWVLPSICFGQTTDREHLWEPTQWFNFLEDLSSASVLEGAHCHGSYGIKIGVGGSSHVIPQAIPRYELQYRESPEVGSEFFLPRVYFTKGTPLQIDFGGHIATDPDRMLTLLGGYAQWTIFQEKGLPAAALRSNFTQLAGVESTTYQGLQTEVLGSYGFLRFLEIYGGGGVGMHAATYQAEDDNRMTLLPDSIIAPASKSADWVRPLFRMGLKIQLGSPFFALTSEYTSLQNRQILAGKLSIGL